MTSIISTLKKNKASLFLSLLFVVLPLLMMTTITYFLVMYTHQIQLLTNVEWFFVFLCTCITMAFSITPTTFVALSAGFFLNYYAIIPLFICYNIASLLAYFLSAIIDKGNFEKTLEAYPKVAILSERLRKDAFWGVVFARLSPVLPFGIMNVFLALNKVPIKMFLGAGAVGMLPRTLLAIWVGTQVSSINTAISEQSDMLPYQIGIALLTLFSFVGIYFYIKKLSA